MSLVGYYNYQREDRSRMVEGFSDNGMFGGILVFGLAINQIRK